jgi:RNA exonuclease 4
VQRPTVGDKSLPGHTSDALVTARATVSGPFPAPEPKGEHARVLALDCEMVGVGYDGKRSALAQVVIVDWSGNVLLNRYVRPAEAVTDFRTFVSGITPAHLKSAEPLKDVQRDVAALLHGRVLVGHGLENDMKALLLSHPASMTRDTAKFQTLCWRAGVSGKWRASKLKILAEKHLQLNVQVKGAAHEPAEDARTALALYKLFRREWEYSLLSRPAGKGVAKK